MVLVLTWAASGVDAISYLGLGHVFTANMTGNAVLLGLAVRPRARIGGLTVDNRSGYEYKAEQRTCSSTVNALVCEPSAERFESWSRSWDSPNNFEPASLLLSESHLTT